LKVAFSGTHAVGKSTLINVLAAALPGFHVIEEPYVALLETGHAFADPPAADDFELQLERSLVSVAGGGANRMFDRTPADFLAYLAVLRHVGVETLSTYWNDVTSAMREFDLVVYVPMERPDRIEVAESEYPRLRKQVDRALRRFLVEDELGVADRVVEVRGSLADRAKQVKMEIEHLRAKIR
jgi:hypothetical protein